MAMSVVEEIMTRDPVTVDAGDSLTEVAKKMRDEDIGPVIVCRGSRVLGIVTDRDIVVRALAEARDPAATSIGEISSTDIMTLSPGDPIDEAVRIMRDNSVRRLPVVDRGRAVGIVSLGDLAQDRDPESALAEISAAPPNN